MYASAILSNPDVFDAKIKNDVVQVIKTLSSLRETEFKVEAKLLLTAFTGGLCRWKGHVSRYHNMKAYEQIYNIAFSTVENLREYIEHDGLDYNGEYDSDLGLNMRCIYSYTDSLFVENCNDEKARKII